MGEQGGAHYITMEFVEGTTLQDLLRASDEEGRARASGDRPARAARIAFVGVRGPRGGPRGGRRAPRPQAGERADRARRSGGVDRLRHRPGADGRGRRGAHAGRGRHAAVHGAGAALGHAGRCARRHLRARADAVRDVDGHAAVRRRDADGGRAGAPDPAAARPAGDAAGPAGAARRAGAAVPRATTIGAAGQRARGRRAPAGVADRQR